MSQLNPITKRYLADLGIDANLNPKELINQLQSRHIAKYSFNSLSVVLKQDISLDLEIIFKKIVTQGMGGYCFEHNKLVFDVLQDLGLNVRILMARVVYNQDIDSPRTHRLTLLTLNNEQYIVDCGFGHFGARQPIKLELGMEQNLGDACYRIIQNERGEYCYQIIKDDEFFTLFTFDLGQYNESDCLLGHFYSHKYPTAGFVNNLVVCRKEYDHIRSLRNHEFHRIQGANTEVVTIDTAAQLTEILEEEYSLNLDPAIIGFLFQNYVELKKAS